MSSYFGGTLRIPYNGGLTFPDATGNTVVLQANTTINSPYTLVLPDTDGTNGQLLQTNGSGALSWSSGASSTVAADDIEPGDSQVNISTTSGDIYLDAPSGRAVYISIDGTIRAGFNNTVLDVGPSIKSGTSFTPSVNDGATLGTTSLSFSDLFLASGAVVNFNNGDITMTHSLNALTVNGGSLVMANDRRIHLRNQNTTIHSSVDGRLALTATNMLDINSSLISLTGAIETNSTFNSSNVTQSTSTTTGAITTDGGMGVSKNLHVGGNVSVGDSFTLSVDNFTEDSDRFDLFSTGNLATVKNITISSSSIITDSFYDCNAAPAGSGTLVHLFFANDSETPSTANISFTNSNLFTGSGVGNYLVFDQTGQSASLIYLAGEGLVDGWRIVNVGGQVF